MIEDTENMNEKLWDTKELASLLKGGEGYLALSYVLNKSPGFLRSKSLIRLSNKEEKIYFDIVQKRKKGLPLQYAIGEWEFYGKLFKVDKRALIPRPETELLVEKVLSDGIDGKVCLDLATGSGAIALSLMCHGRPKKMIGTDISREALDLAEENQQRLKLFFKEGPRKMVQWYCVDGPGPLKEKFDLVVSNPPYIDPIEKENLQGELAYEPELALFAGAKGHGGLVFYESWIDILKEKMNPAGLVYFEIGYNQGEYVKEAFKNAGFSQIEIIKDYSDRDRIVKALYK